VRLPFPERISFVYTFYFASALCIAQLIEKTDPTFSLLSFLFILVAALAFNVCGGFTRPSGSYVFFFATLCFIIGVTWKAILGEPAESNLQAPLLTMSIYLGCMTSMLAAAVISRKLTRTRPILGNLINEQNVQRATVGCLVVGLGLTICLMVLPTGSGSVLSALNQMNQFLPLAMILGTIHAIRRSGGTKAFSFPVLVAGSFMFLQGIFGFSKQGIFTPFVCWMLAASSQRYRITVKQIILGAVAVFLSFHYLVPYSQYGRTFREESISTNLKVAFGLMSHLGDVRELYLQTVEDNASEYQYSWYNTPQGFFERLQSVTIDDALIANKSKSSFAGYGPLEEDFLNLIPHFIWKSKPISNQGNGYAHDIGILADDDTTTGVSFSPAAEAYVLMGWTSIILVAPALWIALFTVFDSLCGDTRQAPWGLLVALLYAHNAPEGGLGGIVYMLGYTVIGIVFAALTAAYLMPVIGTFLIGPEGIFIKRAAPIRAIPNRLATAPTPES
jgi:hypothetical protein